MSDTPRPLTAEEWQAFWRDGYLICDALFSAEETAFARRTARDDAAMRAAARDVTDKHGRSTNMTVWNHPGDDVFGRMARCERVVTRMEQLLEDEVYHYHSKLSAKEPRIGGAWEWHQDYGYWYQNGCLWPDMASCFVALDPCTRENGCLQVIRGSHKLGRIDHGLVSNQVGADAARVEQILQQLERVYVEMQAGAAVIFHANTLHTSDANDSEHPRWGLICCYNTRHNDPVIESHHPGYTPIDRVADTDILRTSDDAARRAFLSTDDDRTVPKA